MAYTNVKVPEGGGKISIKDGRLDVPDHPIIPFVEGDGTGRDIWRASARVFDAAVEKAYGGKRKVRWMEVYAGEKSFKMFNNWLPDETVTAFSEFLVGIKGPLTTPIGGGFRSLNVALRKSLVKETFPKEYEKIRFPNTAGIALKPVSVEGTERLVRAAIKWALANKRRNVNFVHKGNIMKYTEGAFMEWGYALAKREFRNDVVTERETWILGNKEQSPNLSAEDNAKMIDRG